MQESLVFERLVSVHLGRFMELSGVLPTVQFYFLNGMGTCAALLCVSHTLHIALESVQEGRIVQINVRAAFNRVHHQVILYILLCSVDIRGFVLSILTKFLSNRSKNVMVYGCPSKLVNVVWAVF